MIYVISFDMWSLMCFYPICTRKDLGLVISSKDLSFLPFACKLLRPPVSTVLNIFSGKLKRKAAAGTYLLGTLFTYISSQAPIDGYLYEFTIYI